MLYCMYICYAYIRNMEPYSAGYCEPDSSRGDPELDSCLEAHTADPSPPIGSYHAASFPCPPKDVSTFGHLWTPGFEPWGFSFCACAYPVRACLHRAPLWPPRLTWPTTDSKTMAVIALSAIQRWVLTLQLATTLGLAESLSYIQASKAMLRIVIVAYTFVKSKTLVACLKSQWLV